MLGILKVEAKGCPLPARGELVRPLLVTEPDAPRPGSPAREPSPGLSFNRGNEATAWLMFLPRP